MTEEARPPTMTPIVDTSAKPELLDRFLKLSGYKAAQVMGSRQRTRTFVTDNGGKYQLNAKGTTLITLQGPAYPKQKAGEDEE